jgi:hypothetical protein
MAHVHKGMLWIPLWLKSYNSKSPGRVDVCSSRQITALALVKNLTTIASRWFGVAKSATISNASTLLHAKYHIRTDLGLSESSHLHCLDAPIYGTGHGSGNSLMIWCFLSSLLHDCYDTRAQPAWYCNPDWSNQWSDSWTIATAKYIPFTTTILVPLFTQWWEKHQQTPLNGPNSSKLLAVPCNWQSAPTMLPPGNFRSKEHQSYRTFLQRYLPCKYWTPILAKPKL